MDNSSINILIYIALWVVTLLIALFKFSSHKSGASAYLFIVVLFCSICSYYSYNDFWISGTYKEVKLFPFIYLYLMVLITTLPAIRYDKSTIVSIQKPSQRLLDVISWIFIICTILTIPSAMQDFASNIKTTLSGAGADLYMEKTSGYETSGTSVSNWPSVIGGFFYYPSIIIAFYYLTIYEKRNKTVMLLLFLSFSFRLARELFFIASYYAMFYRFYTKKIRKTINRVVIVVLLALLIPFMLVTISRFDSALGGVRTSMLFYSGQSSLFFNNYGLDDNGIRYGDRVAPGFKLLLGFDNVPMNFIKRRAKYPNLYINDEVFSTYIGDFTIDFGPWLGGLLLLLLSLFFTAKLKIKNKQIQFHQLMLLGTIVGIISQGYLKLFPFSEVNGNISLVFIFVMCIVFKQDYINQLNKKILKERKEEV